MALPAAQPHPPFPRAAGFVQRDRLLRELTAAFAHKITLICAPPGYGKTTLVVDFTRQSQRPYAWHTIEERQRDLPNLFAQSLTALEQVAPGIGQFRALSGYTPRELAAVVTNYLRDTVREPFIYVLDDVHYLTGSPAAEAWLQALVALLPLNCHLILISRALPNLPITEMVARREVTAIGEQQLRFTPDEIASLADLFGSQLPPQRLNELYQSLEGWPAGTVLAFQPLPPEIEQVALNGGKGPEALFDALATGVVQVQSPTLRNFLLESSTLSHITPELCESVLEIPNSADRFAEALSQHTFLTQVPGGVIYHRLFRQFLQRQLSSQNPGRFTSLHLKAAWWFEQNDQIEDAVDHYISAGQHGLAIVLCERVASAYYAQGKVETLLGWKEYFEHMPVEAPKLFLMCAKIHTDRYDYETAATELHYAEQGFAAQNDPMGLAEVQLQEARCSLQSGNYERAVQLSNELLQSWDEEDRIRGRALRTLGFARMRLGEIHSAIADLEAAVPLYRDDGDVHALSQLLQDMVLVYAQAGRFEEVSACLQEVVALRRSLGSPGALALALNNLGYFYHRCGEYQHAIQTFSEGLSIIAQVSNKRAEGHLLWSLGDVKRDLGAFDEALGFYHKALEYIGVSEPPVRCGILTSLSTLRRWEGQPDEAVALAAEAVALADQHKLGLEGLLARTAVGAARAQAGDALLALEQLTGITEELRRQNSPFETLQALGCCLQVAIYASDQATASEILQLGLQIARGVNTAQPLAAEIANSPVLEAFVRTNTKWLASLRGDFDRLYTAQNKNPAPAPATSQLFRQTTYSLRVWTLGQERIERDGKQVLPSEWRAATARELFLYLLLIGPASREELSLLFWPDNSSRQVRNNFHTTLYRARQALGENVIILDDDRYCINPDVALWCDVHDMQKLIQQAQLLSARDARTEDMWHKAVRLYKGEFLPSILSNWAAFQREKWQETYIEALIGAANCSRARGNLQESLSLLKQAVHVNPYREDIYRAIMQCYADLGERQEVLACYQNLERLFREELGIKPSQETIALVERLLR
ncbi:MAG: tetratricopeptide repeat protein [Chloroflexi bacterium]|nr:tetratricopeptide repeat protein [Chloroflexota bacterium]